MSCNVCYGHVGCPVCSPEPQMCACEYCEGKGFVFEHIKGETKDLTLEEYCKQLPQAQSFYKKIECESCKGEGKLLDEWDYS